MALPKSTFVMGVVTLGLFGLATYETVGKKSHADRKDDVEDRYNDDVADVDVDVEGSDEAIAEYERARLEREQLERQAKLDEELALTAKKAALGQLFGAEVATPGTLFAGIALDSTDRISSVHEEALRAFREQTESSLTTGSGSRFDRFEIEPGEDGDSSDARAMCTHLGEQLHEAWGTGWTSSEGLQIWTNPVTKTRAMFGKRSGCILAFDKYDDPAQWISKAAASTIPLGIIGQPAEKVVAATGSQIEEDAIRWNVHGVGVGGSQTELIARIEKGKVVTLDATVHANVATQEALREHLTATFGKPKLNPDDYRDTTLMWPARKLTVVLSSEDGISIVVGKQ